MAQLRPERLAKFTWTDATDATELTAKRFNAAKPARVNDILKRRAGRF